MALSNSQYDKIMREYNHRQIRNKHDLDERRETAYSQIPRLAEIDREVGELSLRKARALLGVGGDDFDLNSSIRELSEERNCLLDAYGYPADYLDMHYDCPLCRDTGLIGTEKCNCFKKAAVELLYTQSNIRDILQIENFDNFDFSYYPEDLINPSTGSSARDNAHEAVDKAMDFIATFGKDFKNLFIYGDTGVGKTFLSHCIARELINDSFCVIYFSAYDLFDLLAKDKFSRGEDEEVPASDLYDCDLLIIDDLGTELTNSFVTSQLFWCINERLSQKKSTLISTNLSLQEFADLYSERVFSRISSNYTMIKLIGNDIRILKKIKGGSH